MKPRKRFPGGKRIDPLGHGNKEVCVADWFNLFVSNSFLIIIMSSLVYNIPLEITSTYFFVYASRDGHNLIFKTTLFRFSLGDLDLQDQKSITGITDVQ